MDFLELVKIAVPVSVSAFAAGAAGVKVYLNGFKKRSEDMHAETMRDIDSLRFAVRGVEVQVQRTREDVARLQGRLYLDGRALET